MRDERMLGFTGDCVIGELCDMQRAAAYWRHVASGVPLTAIALDEFVLKMPLSQRGASFSLAVAVQGGTLAQLLFVASRFESRTGPSLAAAATAVPPIDLRTTSLLIQAGIVALRELLKPSLTANSESVSLTTDIASRVDVNVDPTVY